MLLGNRQFRVSGGIWCLKLLVCAICLKGWILPLDHTQYPMDPPLKGWNLRCDHTQTGQSGQYVCCFHRWSGHYITATMRHRTVNNTKEHKPREWAFSLFLWEKLQRRWLAGNIIQTKTKHRHLHQSLLHQCNFSKIEMRLENTMASCTCTPISRSLRLTGQSLSTKWSDNTSKP